MHGRAAYFVSKGKFHEATRTKPHTRIERIAPDALANIRRAARIQGRSVSDFVVAAAQEAAQKTIADVEIVRLTRQAQERFISLLLDPPPPNAALRSAFKRRLALLVD
jgi:uncharacterized protein (DUF1778 family)